MRPLPKTPLLLPMLAWVCFGQTPSITTLFGFAKPNSQGSSPRAGVVLARDGTLYGTAAEGGRSGVQAGSVFEVRPPSSPGGKWTHRIVYIFGQDNPSDGISPSGLAMGPKKILYGVTVRGGAFGLGAVFALSPPSAPGAPWTETVLYSFTGVNGDGANPYAAPTLGTDGSLYGTTTIGGSPACACGIVYQLTPPTATGGQWTESVLHQFTGENGDGASPASGLTGGLHGEYYGTTSGGGSMECEYGCGTVFVLNPPTTGGSAWTEQAIHSFKPFNGYGPYPAGNLILDAQGAIYGVTEAGGRRCRSSEGCGAVFKLTPPIAGVRNWSKAQLFAFRANQDGIYPTALVFVPDGDLYVTTERGGTQQGWGTIVDLAPPVSGDGWSLKALYRFRGRVHRSGAIPLGPLVVDRNGVLYGTTEEGGICRTHPGCGTVFALLP